MVSPGTQVPKRGSWRVVDAESRTRLPELEVQRNETERIAERVVENTHVHPPLRPPRQRLRVRPSHGIRPDDVVLEQDFRLGLLDQRQHRQEGVGTVAQESNAVRARDGLAGEVSQPGLELWAQWSDRSRLSRRLDRFERDIRLPFTCVLVTRTAHLAALCQERPDAAGAIRARISQVQLHDRACRPAGCASGAPR